MLKLLALLPLLALPALAHTKDISDIAKATADYAVNHYQQDMVNSLAQLVKHNTVAVDGVSVIDNPQHQHFKKELANQAAALGLDFQDYGYVVVIGLGKSDQRVGVITHGDIQPVNPDKWQNSPFELDLTSEPGKLLGRGTEDDKGPIATALYAMKSIKDNHIQLSKRIELYVYMAEESDWGPLMTFVKNHDLPQVNITIDAEYPVVTAEKGYGTISMTFADKKIESDSPYITTFIGGFFGSQIPEDAQATIANANPQLLATIQKLAEKQQGMSYDYQWQGTQLTITALGKSTHSSKPADGVNAITHLAEILAVQRWPNNASGALVNFVNDHLGTGLYGHKFGNIAYEDDFMGPMTVSPTVLKQLDNGIQLNINIRRPKGKTKQQLDTEINQVLIAWQHKNQIQLLDMQNAIGDPFVQTDAPHIDTLLSVFSHYTGIQDAKPISIGGGTNSRLFPNAVSFGPSMPGEVYTGHSEHEFITMEQFVLNLKMYTAVMVELAH
ncbi:dipeptidase [Alteromonadaceae bacterium BrNp21-10]|nr:dipeptidase [Alteromonadaceae bacterium BrNp21-10]